MDDTLSPIYDDDDDDDDEWASYLSWCHVIARDFLCQLCLTYIENKYKCQVSRKYKLPKLAYVVRQITTALVLVVVGSCGQVCRLYPKPETRCKGLHGMIERHSNDDDYSMMAMMMMVVMITGGANQAIGT